MRLKTKERNGTGEVTGGHDVGERETRKVTGERRENRAWAQCDGIRGRQNGRERQKTSNYEKPSSGSIIGTLYAMNA